MKIFSKYTATGKEWKPCIECGRVFFHGEIVSSIATDSDCSVTYWYCHKCIAKFFPKFGFLGAAANANSDCQLIMVEAGKCWAVVNGTTSHSLFDIDLEYRNQRLDRFEVLQKFSDCSRYMEFNKAGCYLMN